MTKEIDPNTHTVLMRHPDGTKWPGVEQDSKGRSIVPYMEVGHMKEQGFVEVN